MCGVLTDCVVGEVKGDKAEKGRTIRMPHNEVNYNTDIPTSALGMQSLLFLECCRDGVL